VALCSGGTLIEEITTNKLFNILSLEKSTGELQTLDTDFYASVKKFIEGLSQAEGKETEAKNASKLLANLMERRKQKVLIYLAYNKPLPRPIPVEEENLYNEILKILNSSDKGNKSVKIKILEDLPEVITPYGKKLGPFKAGQLIEVDSVEDENFLVVNKIGEKV